MTEKMVEIVYLALLRADAETYHGRPLDLLALAESVVDEILDLQQILVED
jgi:hypothetical protein